MKFLLLECADKKNKLNNIILTVVKVNPISITNSNIVFGLACILISSILIAKVSYIIDVINIKYVILE